MISLHIFLLNMLKMKQWIFTKIYLDWFFVKFRVRRHGIKMWLCMKYLTKKLTDCWDTFTWICIQDQTSLTMQHASLFSEENKLMVKQLLQLLQWWVTSFLTQIQVNLSLYCTAKLSHFSMSSDTSCTTFATKPTLFDFLAQTLKKILLKCQVKCLKIGCGTKA